MTANYWLCLNLIVKLYHVFPVFSQISSHNKPLILVQDEEISSTTPPEPADSTSDPAVADGTQPAADGSDITQQAEASVKLLLKYIDKGYKNRNYCLIKPGRWLEQVNLSGLSLS